MKKLFYAASAYLVLGLASGLFYREFTKANDYTAADGFTQLSVVHTHLLTLGVILLLIVLVLEKVFGLSRSALFGWFFWLYNAGLVISSTTMVLNGVLDVLGEGSSAALAGISGAGHIILTAGLILLFIALGKRVLEEPATAPAGPPSA
jgi:hypothetical protein